VGELDRGLVNGVAVFRWAAWAWMAVVLAVSHADVGRPLLAIALLALALVVTSAATLAGRGGPGPLLRWPAVAGELAAGGLVLACDDAVYDGAHSQALGSAWPLAGVLAAGIALGPAAGAGAGAALGLARALGHLDDSVLSLVSTGFLYALAGGALGLAAERLRRAEAREELARTLHDGVLQTLAIIQRRGDPDLARLAHEQERELREYLYGTGRVAGAGGDLGTALRAAGARFEDRFGATARIVLADDLPRLADAVVDALAGAVAEAMTNAAKHGDARVVTVYAEPADDGGVVCTVKDDGHGFDPATTTEGSGLTSSIRGRMAEVGGTVEVSSRPGRGTEVLLATRGR
jgi:signal transduction histidine kinase